MVATLSARRNYDRRTEMIFYQAVDEQIPHRALMFKEAYSDDYLDPDWNKMELLAQCMCCENETIIDADTAEYALRSIHDGDFCFSQPLLQILIELLPFYRTLSQEGWKFYFTINNKED